MPRNRRSPSRSRSRSGSPPYYGRYSRSCSRDMSPPYYCNKNSERHRKYQRLEEFSEDMGDLFEQKLFTDCSIISADGTEIKVKNKITAHKGILVSRSPVFRAMFAHEMVEAKEGIVKIENIKPPVLEKMIRFIYTGTLPKVGKMAIELMDAAVEYQLDALKMLCEEELRNSITNENVCEMLELANRYSANYLKDKAVSHIKKHTKKVVETEGYKMLVKGNNGELLDQIVKAFV